MRRGILTRNGQKRRSKPSRSESKLTVLNFVACATKSALDLSTRSFDTTAAGKGIFPLLEPLPIYMSLSTKLGEENKRVRKDGPPPEPDFIKYTGNAQRQTVSLPDDDRSVISTPTKAPSCGACRTRESKAWWRAPKGLATALLCDNCGNSWRKYADLNVRPLREESVPSMRIRTEKREGTPLIGPSAKRAKVSERSILFSANIP